MSVLLLSAQKYTSNVGCVYHLSAGYTAKVGNTWVFYVFLSADPLIVKSGVIWVCDCTLCLLKETLRKCRRTKIQRKNLILKSMVLETEQELSDVPVDLYASNAFVAKTLEKSGF